MRVDPYLDLAFVMSIHDMEIENVRVNLCLSLNVRVNPCLTFVLLHI